jgi:mono/diheme cytochrome c family protein
MMIKAMKETMLRVGPALAGAAALLMMQAAAQAEPAKGQDRSLVDRGRYLVKIAGCNDCHTPGYLQAEGKVDERLWLTGDAFGWRGPWGTTYATNLRLFVSNLSQAQWLQHVGTMRPRPPMPYFNLQAMSEQDRKAIYAYLKSLGPAGQPAPAWVPPDKQPAQPYAQFPG